MDHTDLYIVLIMGSLLKGVSCIAILVFSCYSINLTANCDLAFSTEDMYIFCTNFV